MKILQLISGGEKGGSKTHVLSLVKELQKEQQITLACLMEGEFYRQALAMGLDARTLLQKKRYHLSPVWEIGRLFKQEGYQLLHCHGPRANFYGALVKKLYKIPTVTTIHSDYLQDFRHNLYKQRVYATFNKLALNTFDGYFAVSDTFQEMLLSRGFPREKITVIYNGLDFNAQLKPETREEFLKKFNLPIPAQAKLVGILARLHPLKGHEIFLAGASRILAAAPETHFIIGGDGDEKEKLLALRDKLGLRDKVHFLGQISDPPSFFQAIDINTLTSHTESFPYVLLEGALLKKPIVSSAVGGISRLVKDGETGFLFPAGNEVEFARQTLKLLDDENLRNTLGENLFQHARANFSLTRLAEIHLQSYEKYGRRGSN
ncbi:MAG: glycosyltransferase [Dethiobacter sp.]|jgi:glycosyltransferase involved in cell wall biosynthesis|nr:glycosyltransferase [Dethiobacter sp.]